MTNLENSTINKLPVVTPIGTISARETQNPDYPGIEIVLESNDYKTRIAMVEYVKDDGLRIVTYTDNNEDPDTIVMFNQDLEI